MFFTSQIINQMINAVNTEMENPVGTAIKGFDTKELPIPLKNVLFSFVPEKNSVSYFSDDTREHCQKDEATIRMNCYGPITSLASDLHVLAERVLDFLNDRFMLEFSGYTIGSLEYDSDVKAFKIPCKIFYYLESCAADGSQVPILTEPANFFCKTHVKDEDIHITAAEHEKIRAPYEIGTYEGLGYGIDRYIFLDFVPSLVIVFRQGYHPSVYDNENARVINYTGMAFGKKYSRGIKIDPYGFFVHDYYSDGTETRLDEDGATYVYLAVK